jgi:deoxyribose-phosphate aldolase
MSTSNIAKYIDHSLLKPEVTAAQVAAVCQEAKQHGFAAVCVNPGHVAQATQLLAGSPVKVCTVIGFPLGATTTLTKVFETRDAVANGAEELDMVVNIGALKAGDDDLVQGDIEAVVKAAAGRIVKVIIETGLLTDDEKVRAARLVKAAGAHFVKTSTGFSEGGATQEDIRLIRKTVGPDFGVKASGKVRDYATAKAMIEAGATRIGATRSVAIVQEESATQPQKRKG